MVKKIITTALLLGVVSTNVFAGEDGVVIPFSTLMKNSSKVDFMYSMGTETCDSTVESFKSIWSELNIDPKIYKNTVTVLTYFKDLNERVIGKPMKVTTGFPNKSFTQIEDGDKTLYFYFNSLESCQDFSKKLRDSNNDK
jgi:hypothetical protein